MKTAVAQHEVVSAGTSKKFCLWQVKATVENVVGQDEVSVEPATLERKNIQSMKPVLVWQLSHVFDHACGQAL